MNKQPSIFADRNAGIMAFFTKQFHRLYLDDHTKPWFIQMWNGETDNPQVILSGKMLLDCTVDNRHLRLSTADNLIHVDLTDPKLNETAFDTWFNNARHKSIFRVQYAHDVPLCFSGYRLHGSKIREPLFSAKYFYFYFARLHAEKCANELKEFNIDAVILDR